MLKNSKAFSSFAVRDLEAATKFYAQTLGVDVSDVPGMENLPSRRTDQLVQSGAVHPAIIPRCVEAEDAGGSSFACSGTAPAGCRARSGAGGR